MKKANRDAFRKWTCPILNPNHKQKVKCVNTRGTGYIIVKRVKLNGYEGEKNQDFA